MNSRKKGIALILLSLILMLLFMAWQQKEKKKQKELSEMDIQTMAPVQEVASVQSNVIPDAAESPSPEVSLMMEEHDEEEAYPLVMNASALPPRSLEEMNISQKEAAERIRIFANAQGYAGVDKVFYTGETRFDDSNQSVTMDLYFEPKGTEIFYFSFIYYRETEEYVLAQW